MGRKGILIALGILVVAVALILALTLLEAWRGQQPIESGGAALYLRETQTTMIEKADAIFVGKVTDISPTSWNQDGGSPYECSSSDDNCFLLPLHQITILVLQPIAVSAASAADFSKEVTVTVIGESPLEAGTHPDHTLRGEEQGVFFVRETEIAWRNGTKPVLMFMGYPGDSYLTLGSDGNYHGGPDNQTMTLDQLIAEVAQRRSTLPQP